MHCFPKAIILIQSIFSGDNLSSLPKAAEREMLTALAARKEALLDKLKEKMDELKTVCMQEAVSLNLGQNKLQGTKNHKLWGYSS